MTLPGADELFFRSSGTEVDAVPDVDTERRYTAPEQRGSRTSERARSAGRVVEGAPKPSGRQRHDEKITVYISGPELLALEQTRLSLRAEHGLSADRGRLVREAVAVLLADFEEHGPASMLVRRLSEE
ncbi:MULTISPECIES: hypothetical protein [Nocardiopsis]|uniref:Cobyrinic acid a,c-diamide synthase n=1 Tax=Nocardiopsis lambiniae TaxID=3075539 RepID=A0ABU2MCW2_9ACTN|nr:MULTISPECIES: hypothetical protein [unclassified Nocardiopsis]MDE3720354.1 hypothetical protein [Nocardiopsis sp. N85]MDT0330518.1 hypothetical protein [Nocardiopsis sp. DSM 44743]